MVRTLEWKRKLWVEDSPGSQGLLTWNEIAEASIQIQILATARKVVLFHWSTRVCTQSEVFGQHARKWETADDAGGLWIWLVQTGFAKNLGRLWILCKDRKFHQATTEICEPQRELGLHWSSARCSQNYALWSWRGTQRAVRFKNWTRAEWCEGEEANWWESIKVWMFRMVPPTHSSRLWSVIASAIYVTRNEEESGVA